MEDLTTLFENNKRWVAGKTSQDPNFFKNLARDQDPPFLWIGCSDSRVPANEIIGLEPGELFVHRNVANLFPHSDFNCLSVLEFAVLILKVKHIIVCGHYGCAGIKAAMEDNHLGLVDNWLRNVRDVYSFHKDELKQIPKGKARHERLVELNTIEQAKNVAHTTIVQEAWMRGHSLYIHAFVYSLETGFLKDLKRTIASIDQIEPIYKIQIPEG